MSMQKAMVIRQLFMKHTHLEMTKDLVEHGADIEAVNDDGLTPLMYHAKWFHDDIVKYLLSLGANNKAKDKTGKTALHYATELEMTKDLVEHGADIEVVNNKGETPLFSKSKEGEVDIVKYLLSVGANKNAKTINGQTAYDLAFTASLASNKEKLKSEIQKILK